MRILVTGGTGSLGRALINKLLLTNHEIIVYSRDEGKQAQFFSGLDAVECVIGDIRDYEKLNITARRTQPDWIIHTAALKRIEDMEFPPI